MEGKRILRDVAYEELLVYVINRINAEYGNIAYFSRHRDVRKIEYVTRKGEPFPAERICSYLSYGEGKSALKSVKFLKALCWALWALDVEHRQIIEKRTILKAAI